MLPGMFDEMVIFISPLVSDVVPLALILPSIIASFIFEKVTSMPFLIAVKFLYVTLASVIPLAAVALIFIPFVAFCIVSNLVSLPATVAVVLISAAPANIA